MPRHSLSKKQHDAREYTKKARKLRLLGFDLNYNPAKKQYNGSHYKAAVSKAYNRAKFYVDVPGQIFYRYRKPSSRKKWRTVISSDQDMPSGFFYAIPPGVKRIDYKIRLKKRGGRTYIEIRTKDRRAVRDAIIQLDATALAVDPRAHLEIVLKGFKRPRRYMLRIHGHPRRSDRNPDGYSNPDVGFADLDAFIYYVSEPSTPQAPQGGLIAQLDRHGFDYERWGAEVFTLVLVYSKPGEKAEGEGKRIGGKEGIFELGSRSYGSKRWRNRGKHDGKGKHKGR